MWNLVPWPGIEPRSPESGAWSLSHWTTGKSLLYVSLNHLFPLAKHRFFISLSACPLLPSHKPRCLSTFSLKLPLTSVAQFSSVAQSCLTLCDQMDWSTLGLPVHHQFPELAQIHVHWVGDAIQLSHRLSSPSPPTFNLSQHQGLFQWVSSLYQVARVLELQLL